MNRGVSVFYPYQVSERLPFRLQQFGCIPCSLSTAVTQVFYSNTSRTLLHFSSSSSLSSWKSGWKRLTSLPSQPFPLPSHAHLLYQGSMGPTLTLLKRVSLFTLLISTSLSPFLTMINFGAVPPVLVGTLVTLVLGTSGISTALITLFSKPYILRLFQFQIPPTSSRNSTCLKTSSEANKSEKTFSSEERVSPLNPSDYLLAETLNFWSRPVYQCFQVKDLIPSSRPFSTWKRSPFLPSFESTLPSCLHSRDSGVQSILNSLGYKSPGPSSPWFPTKYFFVEQEQDLNLRMKDLMRSVQTGSLSSANPSFSSSNIHSQESNGFPKESERELVLRQARESRQS